MLYFEPSQVVVLLKSPDIAFKQIEKYQKKKDMAPKLNETIESVTKRINSCYKAESNILDLYENGYISEKTCKGRLTSNKKRLKELKEEKLKLTHNAISEQEREKRVKSLKEVYKSLQKLLDNTTFDSQRTILKMFVNQVIINRNELEVEYSIPFINTAVYARSLTHATRMDRTYKYGE